VNVATITLCVASQRVFIVTVVYLVMTRSGNFWILPRILIKTSTNSLTVVKIDRVG
jgi:hypothetical protein